MAESNEDVVAPPQPKLTSVSRVAFATTTVYPGVNPAPGW